MIISLRFETTVAASQQQACQWVTSFPGISREMAPYLQMSVQGSMKDLSKVAFQPGKPLFVSYGINYSTVQKG